MDLEERKERFVEALNSRVLAEYIKIVNIPISMRKDFDQMLEDILRLLGHERNDDRHPLSWPRPCDVGASTMGIMVKTTYTFWKWFTTTVKEVLKKYNLDHGTKIMILQEKTIRQTDLNRLCLMLRMQIRSCYERVRKTVPDIRIRREKVEIKGVGMFDPVILCRRLGWKLPSWHGTPINELLDIRLKKEEEAGTLIIGDLILPGLSLEDQKKDNEDLQPMGQEMESQAEASNKENYAEVVKRKKRFSNGTESVVPKKSKKVGLLNNSMPGPSGPRG